MSCYSLPPYLRWWCLAALACVLGLGLAGAVVRAADDTEAYLVKDGDTLEAIAAAYGLTVPDLLALNPDAVAAGIVYVGEVLRVPRTTATQTGPPVACLAQYTVRTGDTWASVADAHEMSAATLAAVNHQDPATEPVPGTSLCLPVASTRPPAPRMECEGELQYVLQGPDPAMFNYPYTGRALSPGLQVCVQTSLKAAGGLVILKVTTETGEAGLISSRHVGLWQAYLASTDLSAPTPSATPRPAHTPTPTPTSLRCRDAWGASAVGYRVRRGPGTQHAHTGRYVSAGQPVCELRRDQGWVFVHLADGETGWVHADGITHSRPTPTPIPSPTSTPEPTPATPPTPKPDSARQTSSGIVIRHHEYSYTINIPAGWRRQNATYWLSEGNGRRVWGELHVRSINQPAGTTLDHFAYAVRDSVQQEWRVRWPSSPLFQITSFEKRRVRDQEFYSLKYRVRESAQYCILDVEEMLSVGGAAPGPAQGFRVQHWSCAELAFGPVRRAILDSFRIVERPSYYTQYLDADGIWIKAPSQVDPRALHVAADRMGLLLKNIRRGIPACLAAAGADLAIIPEDSYVTALPEYAYLKGKKDRTGRPYDGFSLRGLGGVPGQPVSLTSEENLLQLPGDTYAFVDVTIHEYAHAIDNLCFTPTEQSQLELLFADVKQSGLFPGAYATTHIDEFFAIFTTVYFDATSELTEFGIPRRGGRQALRQKAPELFAFLERIYNAD